MKSISILEKLFNENGSVISTADAVRAGISRMTLSQLVNDGKLERVAHGRYSKLDTFSDELHLLQIQSEKIIFSHETALYLHDMAERTPVKHSLTIPSDSKLSPTASNGCKIYYVKPELHGVGTCLLPSKMGNMVLAYNKERTLCDILRSRSRVESQTFAAAINNYTSGKGQDFRLLMEYAEMFRVTKLLRQYLEVLS
jgi:predicted transcriptional regulator of viral defense system